MALRIIDGVPGSGKSFYAVRHVAKTYFKKNKSGDYIPDPKKRCVLISNIEDFKPDHIDLVEEIKKAGGVKVFFSKTFQDEYRNRYEHKLVYVIDEAQMLLRKGTRGLDDVYAYFEYHRHWGQDIYLVTQNVKKLPPDIVQLVEHIIRAAPRCRSLTGEFKYTHLDGTVVMKREAFRPSPAVFALYKSMEVAESEKITNPIIRQAGITIIISILFVGGMGYYFKKHWTPEEIVTKDISSNITGMQSSGKVNVTGGRIDSAPPVTNLVHFVPLDTIEEFGQYKKKTFFIWQNDIYERKSFPYHIQKIGGKWYTRLSQEIFNVLYADGVHPRGQIVMLNI